MCLAQILTSEEDEPMDEDRKGDGKEDEDDLAKYNLDDYDKESKSIGVYALLRVPAHT